MARAWGQRSMQLLEAASNAIPDACALWPYATDSRGYPKIMRRGAIRYGHRWVAELYHGILPGQVAAHSCDNPRCVNPWHIRATTQADNIAEAWAKGRMTGKGKAPAKRGTLAAIQRA